MNKVIFIGNLGKDPETKKFDSGSQVTNVSLATKNFIKKDDGTTEVGADWHFLKFWGKTSEIVEKYCKKGSKIAVEGQHKTESYEKEGTNEKVFHSYFLCQAIELLDSKPKNENDSGGEQHNVNPDDDLPF